MLTSNHLDASALAMSQDDPLKLKYQKTFGAKPKPDDLLLGKLLDEEMDLSSIDNRPKTANKLGDSGKKA